MKTEPKELNRNKTTLNFAPARKVSLWLVVAAIVSGFLLWFPLEQITEWRLRHRLKTLPSPFITLLGGTPLDGAYMAVDGDQVKLLIHGAIREIHLKDINGEDITDTADIDSYVYSALESTRQKGCVFDWSGADTVALLVQHATVGRILNTSNSKDSSASLALNWSEKLQVSLSAEDAIVKSSDDLLMLMIDKNIPENVAHNIGGVLVEENSLWQKQYQVILRCIQILQQDEGVKRWRFFRAFLGGRWGFDVCAMISLFWFIIYSLVARWSEANYANVEFGSFRDNVIGWVDRLKQSDFNGVGGEMKKIKDACSSPFLEQILDVSLNELTVRGNDSTPNGLMLFFQGLREENASSRWLLSWCGRALPTTGFIFKVYFIASAMKSADSIAIAVGRYEQGAAIASVSGALGTAFAATVVAFLLGLVAGFCDSYEAHKERELIGDWERCAMRLMTVPPTKTTGLSGGCSVYR